MPSSLTVIPQRREVRAGQYAGLKDLLVLRGINPEPILERHGLESCALEDPDHCLDRRAVVQLLEYCSRVLDDPLFGCRLAVNQGLEIYGPVSAAIRYAPTLRSALNNKARYVPIFHAPDLVSELAEGQDIAEFRWQVEAGGEPTLQAHLQAALLNLQVVRGAIGQDFRPRYIQLTAEIRPAQLEPIEALLQCPVLPGAPVNAIAMPTELLGRPVATHEPTIHALIVDHLEKVARNQDNAIERRAENYIARALPLGDCSIVDCARELGFASIRTLQERLLARGHTFTDLVERVRRSRAEELLEAGHLPLEAITAALGYSEQAAFGRAFKRWTGLTPHRFRRQRQQDGAVIS